MQRPGNFQRANAFTQRWEAGFVNHPKDPGGVTYNGLSLRFLQQRKLDIDGDGKVDANDVLWLYANKAQDKVDAIFCQAFWVEYGLNAFSACLPLQAVLYDTAVNCGQGRATRCLQTALNTFPRISPLAVDGGLGPKTRAATLDIIALNCGPDLAKATLGARVDFHKSLANKSPYPDGRDYRPFIKGWLNRCDALGRYLEEMM